MATLISTKKVRTYYNHTGTKVVKLTQIKTNDGNKTSIKFGNANDWSSFTWSNLMGPTGSCNQENEFTPTNTYVAWLLDGEYYLVIGEQTAQFYKNTTYIMTIPTYKVDTGYEYRSHSILSPPQVGENLGERQCLGTGIETQCQRYTANILDPDQTIVRTYTRTISNPDGTTTETRMSTLAATYACETDYDPEECNICQCFPFEQPQEP